MSPDSEHSTSRAGETPEESYTGLPDDLPEYADDLVDRLDDILDDLRALRDTLLDGRARREASRD